MSSLVTFTEEEQYCLVQMDDGKANALSFAMFDAINTALDSADATGKVVVLAGRPGKFSAGFDLSVMAKMDEDTMCLMQAGADLSRRLLQNDKPVVLAVSGHALAMGALLTVSADYRIGMNGNYKIGLNEVAISMTLPHFAVELARERLSKRHLRAAVTLARVTDASGAVAAGYLDEAVDEADLLPRAVAVAQQFAALDMEAYRNTKARVNEGFYAELERAVARDFAQV